MLEAIPATSIAIPCDLFGVEPAMVNVSASTDRKPRNATSREVRAYFDWLRRRAGLPDLGTISLDCGDYGSGYRNSPVCRGATFGKQLAPAKWEGQRHIPAQFEEGAYSIAMPGYSRQPARVTFETLDEAGEILGTSTLPVEPKKGGIIWTAADVRKAHGTVDKPKRATSRRKSAAPIVEMATPEPVQHENEPLPPPTPAEAPETMLSGPEIAPEPQTDAPADPTAGILARLDALESQLATLSAVSTATPTSGKRARSLAHDRAIRRAWAERRKRIEQADLDRRAMLKANADNRLLLEQLQKAEAARDETMRRADALRDERDAALAVARDRLELIAHESERRVENARRARRMLIASRKTARHQAQRADVLAAQLHKLRSDIADPSQPERSSDISRLMRERDEARTALSAVIDRARRAEQSRDQLAGLVEAMGTRLANAEAAVRRLAAA